MPNIQEYNAQIGPVNPNDSAATTAREAGMVENKFARETGEALGSAIARAGGQIGDIVNQHETATAISQGAAAYSSMYANLHQQWTDVAGKADPNDHSVMAGFSEKNLEPALDKFKQAFDGATPQAKQWAESRIDTLRQDFTKTMIADSATRAGYAVHKNLNDMVQNFSNVVNNDPTALAHVVDTVKSGVETIVSNSSYLSADERSRVTQEVMPQMLKKIGQSAYEGLAEKNPDAAKQSLAKGDYDAYMDAQEKIRYGKFADEIKRAKIEDDNRAYELAQRQKRDQQETVMTGFINRVITGGKVSGAEIAADPTLSPSQRENMINFQYEHTRQIREKVENTPHPESYRGLLNDLFTKAHKDPNNLSVQPIREAFQKGMLNPHEEAELETRFNNMDKPMERNFHAQVQRLDRALQGSNNGHLLNMAKPAEYAALITNIERDAYTKLNKARDAGEDVNPLLDPNNKQYLFAPAVINSYMKTAREVMADHAESIKQEGAKPQEDKQQGSAFVAGQVYRFKQDVRKFKGGNPKDPANWEKAE